MGNWSARRMNTAAAQSVQHPKRVDLMGFDCAICCNSGRWRETEGVLDPRAQRGGHQVELGLGRAGDAGEEVVCAFDEKNSARL